MNKRDGVKRRTGDLKLIQANEINAKMFRQALAEKDALAVSILEKTASYLAAGMVNLIHLFNQEVIILGGEIAFENGLLIEKVLEYVCGLAGMSDQQLVAAADWCEQNGCVMPGGNRPYRPPDGSRTLDACG